MSMLFINYCMMISFFGVVLLAFLALCCFVNVEALRLPHGTKTMKGLSLLGAAFVIHKLT
jgi:hypothetical protein